MIATMWVEIAGLRIRTAIRHFLVRRLKRSAVRHIRMAGKRIVQAEKMEKAGKLTGPKG